MAMEDNIDTHPAKKIKLQQDEEIPKSQHGTSTVNFEDPQPRREYIMYVSYPTAAYLIHTREEPMSFFRSMMKDVCCETQILKRGHSLFCFVANLTPEEAKKVSGLDFVGKMRPYERELFY